MTDIELIAKKLAFVETSVAELRRLAQPDLIATDIRERRFVEHTLQIEPHADQIVDGDRPDAALRHVVVDPVLVGRLHPLHLENLDLHLTPFSISSIHRFRNLFPSACIAVMGAQALSCT